IGPAAGAADAMARRALPLLSEDLLTGRHQLLGRHAPALERELLRWLRLDLGNRVGVPGVAPHHRQRERAHLDRHRHLHGGRYGSRLPPAIGTGGRCAPAASAWPSSPSPPSQKMNMTIRKNRMVVMVMMLAA